MDIIQVPGLPGWVGMAITLIVAFIWELRRNKASKSEAVKEASAIATKAKDEAIEAMDKHLDILKERIVETEKENAKLHHIVETIYTALRARGIHVTIDGEMIHIRDNGNSTTIRIKKEELS